MSNRLVIVGAPSSAGAYAPGQEKAPAALRSVGLVDLLTDRGVLVEDYGDVTGYRWCPDRDSPRAMNASHAATVAKATGERVAAALATKAAVLVVGGDCTVELGTIAGALQGTSSVGVVYVDLDSDLNTPETTSDGALDWMGVAHMLGLEGTVTELSNLGPREPMLLPEEILLYATDNSTPFERKTIDDLGITEVGFSEVVADPTGSAHGVVTGWARQFDRLLVHLDVDVLDFAEMPLAENTRRNVGLRFDQLTASLAVLLRAPNWAALTVCELNPDHGHCNGSTLRHFATALADALAGSPRWTGR